MFIEPRPDLIAPNPGGADDPLGESVLDRELPAVRVFVPRDVRVVIGRGQDPTREVRLDRCRADAIPVHRRVSGGGAVVLAPGMVVVALRLPPGGHDADRLFGQVNAVLAPAVADCCGVLPRCRGHGDLALTDADGQERKILGASLRQNAQLAAYLGVFLVEDAVPLMEAYLAHPSREPGYRAGRGHRAFCTHLGAHGATAPALIAALARRLAAGVPDRGCPVR